MAARAVGRGWILYSSIMMMLLGGKLVLDGLWALDRSATAVAELPYHDDLGTWGWIWLIAGVVVFVAGIAVLYRVQWAQIVGIGAALIAAFMNLSFLYAYPISAFVGVFMALLVVYGLAAYGDKDAL
jgi:hypothetical protein